MTERVILHVDGDAFFASCEVALDPSLRGKPVVTGADRGIVTSANYEAKARGVGRGVKLADVKKLCPDAVVLPSNHEAYRIFSRRMYGIVRRYSPAVEEYGIDECFADLTGLRRTLGMPYGQAAAALQQDLERELGMTFSVGLGPNKVIAKAASKWKKPAGLTVISPEAIERHLKDLPVGKVWGVGPRTADRLKRIGIRTALDLASKTEAWAASFLDKPQFGIWQELQGESVFPLSLGKRPAHQSICRTRTFRPPTADKEAVFAELSQNIEALCARARRYGLAAGEISFFLKTWSFSYATAKLPLSVPLNTAQEILRIVRPAYERAWRPDVRYRATGVTLGNLADENRIQPDLFGAAAEAERTRVVARSIDLLADRFGAGIVRLGSSVRKRQEPPLRPERPVQLFGLPFLGEAS